MKKFIVCIKRLKDTTYTLSRTMATTTDIRFHDFVESGDLGFNKMLLKITRQIEPEELRRLKFLCRGPSGLSTREIDKLTTPEDFFTSLQRLQMLTRDNLLLLQELLRCLDRTDLLRIVEEYAETLGNTLYFYEAPDQPANGFIHARFHVAGNLKRFQRSKLEDLRAYVSRLLNEPQEFIFLVGVEKGSVNLIFMISEQYADQLKDLYEKHKDSFSRFGVDGIFVADKPAIDERSLDLPTAHEQRYRDSSSQTNLEPARIREKQLQVSALQKRLDKLTDLVHKQGETTNKRLDEVTHLLHQYGDTTENRFDKLTSLLHQHINITRIQQAQQTRRISLFADKSEVAEYRGDHWVQVGSELRGSGSESDLLTEDVKTLQINPPGKRESKQTVKEDSTGFRRDYSPSRSVSDSGLSAEHVKALQACAFARSESDSALPKENVETLKISPSDQHLSRNNKNHYW